VGPSGVLVGFGLLGEGGGGAGGGGAGGGGAGGGGAGGGGAGGGGLGGEGGEGVVLFFFGCFFFVFSSSPTVGTTGRAVLGDGVGAVLIITTFIVGGGSFLILRASSLGSTLTDVSFSIGFMSPHLNILLICLMSMSLKPFRCPKSSNLTLGSRGCIVTAPDFVNALAA